MNENSEIFDIKIWNKSLTRIVVLTSTELSEALEMLRPKDLYGIDLT